MAVSTETIGSLAATVAPTSDEPLDDLGLGETLADVGQLQLERHQPATVSRMPWRISVLAEQRMRLDGELRPRGIGGADTVDRAFERIAAPLGDLAATSAPTPPVRCGSWTTSSRPVRSTLSCTASDVPRIDGAQVDDLGVDALGRSLLAAFMACGNQAAVGHQGEVGPGRGATRALPSGIV